MHIGLSHMERAKVAYVMLLGGKARLKGTSFLESGNPGDRHIHFVLDGDEEGF